MLSVDHTDYGIKISYKSYIYIQNSSSLKQIWNNLSKYYDIVDTNEIKLNNENSNHIFLDYDFNKTLINIDPKKTLSYVSDCTKEDCLFNRYKYKTRDCVFDFLVENINEKKLSKFNILFVDSFQLLNELIYLTKMIKNGYTITEIHLLDQTYCNFLLTLGSLEIITEDFLNQNKLGWVFYQFLEYFYSNGYPIDIYIHGNQIVFGKKNINRIDITIGVDVNTSFGMDDILTNIAICMVNKSDTLNIITNASNIKLFSLSFNQITICSYAPHNIIGTEKIKNFDEIMNVIYNELYKCSHLIIINSLLNTVYKKDSKIFQKNRIIKEITYNNIFIIHYVFLLIIILSITIIITQQKGKTYSWILIFFLIITIVFFLYNIKKYKPINYLKINN